MIEVSFNGSNQHVESVEELACALDEFDEQDQFELWCSVPEGPSLCMLRSGARAWLMYLCFPEDAGHHSVGDTERNGTNSFLLSNGQVDEYPAAWCIDLEQCYKAVAYFFVNVGDRAPWVNWQAD